MMAGEFELEYDAALHSDDKAKEWLADTNIHGGLYLFAGSPPNTSSLDVVDPATGRQKLTTINYENFDKKTNDDDNEVDQDRLTFSLEISVDDFKIEIFHFMLRIVAELEKNGDTLAVLESMSTGRTIRRTTEDVVPRCVRQFSFYSRVVYDIAITSGISNVLPLRRVVICIPADASLTVLVEKLAPALATGLYAHIILDGFKPVIAFDENDETKSTTVNLALIYFVHMFQNIEYNKLATRRNPIDLTYIRQSILELPHYLVKDMCWATMLFTGDISEGTRISNWIAVNTNAKLYKPLFKATCKYLLCVMIFDSCDIDAAVDGLVSALCVATEQRLQQRVLIHEDIWGVVMCLLIARLIRLRPGNVLDKMADLGPLTSSGVKQLLQALRAVPSKMREFRGADGDFLSFRTANEAAQLANDIALDVRVSVWTEDASLAFRVADMLLTANVIWINGIDLYDAAVPVASNCRLSKHYVVGGLRCAYQHLDYGIVYRPTKHSDIVVSNGKQLATGDLKSVLLAAAADARKVAFSRAILSVKQRTRFLGEALLAIKINFLLKKNLDVNRQYDCLTYCQAKCSQTEVHEHVQGDNCRARATVTYRPLGLVAVICLNNILQKFLLLALPAIAYGNAVVFIIIDPSFSWDNHPVLARILVSAPSSILKVEIVDQPLNNVLDVVGDIDFDAVFISVDCLEVYTKLAEKCINHINTNLLLDDYANYPQQFNQKLFFTLTRPKSVWETFSNK